MPKTAQLCGPGFKKGSIVIPLLLLLIASGFVLVKALKNTFTNKQLGIEAGLENRFNPDSTRYSLSKYMGNPSEWQTYKSTSFNYQFRHPNIWIKTDKKLPATLEYHEVGLSDSIKLSVSTQNTFTENNKSEKINSRGITFYILQNDEKTKSAYVKKDDLYYIIRLNQNNYFGSESEFKGTFYQILKNFEFKD